MFLPLLILALSAEQTWALNNGLARTPPMGWNPYNAFLSVLVVPLPHFDFVSHQRGFAFPRSPNRRCDTVESQYHANALKLISLGLKSLGYEYLNL